MTPEVKRQRQSLFLALFLLTFFTYASFFNGGGWNQNAHFALTRAIVEEGTLRIDSYRIATFDISEYDGHIYANKAPGISLLAVPVYAALHAMVDAELRNTITFATFAAWICTIAVCALPGALLVVWIARHLILSGTPDVAATAIALTVGFGSMLMPFSSMLFLHTASTFFLFVSWDLVIRKRHPVIAGCAAGMAGLCNYLCIPLAFGFLVLHAIRSRSARRTIIFCVAAAGPAIVLAGYQLAAFGSPFSTTLNTLPEHFVEDDAVGGILRAPSLPALFHLTLSPYRGILYSMPVLLWGVWGAVRGARHSSGAKTALVLSALLLVANASFNGWHTGSSYGPRYLIPIIPLLMVYAAPVWDVAAWLRRAAVAWSVFVAALATAVNPMVDPGVPSPLRDYLMPLFFRGELSARLEQLPGDRWKQMLGYVSVNEQTIVEAAAYIFVPPGSAEAFWASFNLAELLFPGSRWSVITIALCVGASAVLILRHARSIESASAASVSTDR